MIEVKEYPFPDCRMAASSKRDGVYIYQPDMLCVVLGQGDKIAGSVHLDAIEDDHIPVFRRPSGGEAVVLSPRTLVIAAWKKHQPLVSPLRYFRHYNEQIISLLEQLGISRLKMQGISDICIGNRKIFGSSIYRDKETLLFHGVLNVSEDVARISRYLKHPSREPAYRSSRLHSEFITSIHAEGYKFCVKFYKSYILSSLLV